MPGTTRGRPMPHRAGVVSLTLALGLVVALVAVLSAAPVRLATVAAASGPGAKAPPVRSGPAPAYQCSFNVNTDAFTGAGGTASAIGWLGAHNNVVTCLGGTFMVQDGPDGYFRNYGFGIYGGQRTTWADAGGYLPEQVTTFADHGTRISITEFADRVVVAGSPYVAVYSRVRATNTTDHSVTSDPEASTELVPLDSPPDAVPPHHSVDHDYVFVADRFSAAEPWPGAAALAAAGTFDAHEAHMSAFWTSQLAGIAHVSVPDRGLVDAYDSGLITTQIARSGDALNTGVNGYQSEFSHDVVGILTNLFTQGFFTDAHALLTEARQVVGSPDQYVDGLWTYDVPWAVYLMKTGDRAFVAQNFSTEGPAGAAEPSIEDAAHAVAADRTGPEGTMEATNDIDTQGYWTQDDFEALLGLAAYRYLAATIGDTSEAAWASSQYDSLLAATDAVLVQTIAAGHIHYLPCSLLQPNTANRCTNPKDANWTSPLAIWAWEGSLLGARISGPGLTMIDATYDYGFGRLRGILPPGTTGGFPGADYSSAYDAAQGSAGLASTRHRDQGIVGYEFMLARTQSGPLSWWESSNAPDPHSRWVGSHPISGQGSSPHAWGMAGANKVLLDSIVAQRTDGALVVGRGVPPSWLRRSTPVSVTNFPTTDGRRISLSISTSGSSVALRLRGPAPAGPVVFSLPSFLGNVASATHGTVDEAAGTVTLRPGVRLVTVTLRHNP